MNNAKLKCLVLSLIKDDLINLKLLNNLSSIGLNADDYCLNLSSVILDLMGLGNETERNEEIFAGYVEHTKKVRHIEIIKNADELDKLSRMIYDYLELKKG